MSETEINFNSKNIVPILPIKVCSTPNYSVNVGVGLLTNYEKFQKLNFNHLSLHTVHTIVCSHSQCPQNYDVMTLYVI